MALDELRQVLAKAVVELRSTQAALAEADHEREALRKAFDAEKTQHQVALAPVPAARHLLPFSRPQDKELLMDFGFGVMLLLAALTFLLAAVLQCFSLRKHEELIARLERLQGSRTPPRDEPPSYWSTKDLLSSTPITARRSM
jgi:hypothetical protein